MGPRYRYTVVSSARTHHCAISPLWHHLLTVGCIQGLWVFITLVWLCADHPAKGGVAGVQLSSRCGWTLHLHGGGTGTESLLQRCQRTSAPPAPGESRHTHISHQRKLLFCRHPLCSQHCDPNGAHFLNLSEMAPAVGQCNLWFINAHCTADHLISCWCFICYLVSRVSVTAFWSPLIAALNYQIFKFLKLMNFFCQSESFTQYHSYVSTINLAILWQEMLGFNIFKVFSKSYNTCFERNFAGLNVPNFYRHLFFLKQIKLTVLLHFFLFFLLTALFFSTGSNPKTVKWLLSQEENIYLWYGGLCTFETGPQKHSTN